MKSIKEMDTAVSAIVRQNLKKVMDEYGFSVRGFSQYIKGQLEIAPDRTTFLRFMNSNDKSASIGLLISCCKAFNLSLDNLISENFNPKENYDENKIRFSAILKNEPYLSKSPEKSDLIKDLFPCYSSEVFVENPNSPILKNYMQTYHCYYYSTVSSENKADDTKESILSGTLEIKPNGSICQAILRIDTKTFDKHGERNYKTYVGKVVVCPSIQSLHCIMALEEGEFCFLIFRYSHLNFANQECRIAEVLSTSSTLDKRYPIVHRMLLCKEAIHEKDLEVIAPHLWLNYSDITVSRGKLMELSRMSEEYNQIVQKILKEDSEEMFCIKEKTARKIAEDFLRKEELPMFITNLRAHSFNYRYNKVSPTADNVLRDVLVQLGYFQKNSPDMQ